MSSYDFFAHPFRGLNENFDPIDLSLSTSPSPFWGEGPGEGPRSLARENSANSGREVRFEHLALRAAALVIAGYRQFAFALRDAALGQDVCPKIS